MTSRRRNNCPLTRDEISSDRTKLHSNVPAEIPSDFDSSHTRPPESALISYFLRARACALLLRGILCLPFSSLYISESKPL